MSTTVSPTTTSTPSERAWALFKVLKDKELIPEGYIEQLTQLMEHQWSPENGARVVAKAWVDPQFRELLLRDGTAACAQFGYTGPQGEYIVALEDSSQLKNVIVCSLCSCTNWLREMGTELPSDVVVKVWDTSAESRYLVLPVRPEGSEHMNEEELQRLVTKDVLIGVALPSVR
jgi:nitrile hydratase